MTSRREPSRDELQAMKRVDLQRMAKVYFIFWHASVLYHCVDPFVVDCRFKLAGSLMTL
jgi:hypothetical protein